MTMAESGGEMGAKTRIYVGGLGGGVTEEDLRKTFSSLGEVVAVDVVRTKGRSFAYLDFIPSNDKSLPKLFSTYNGCMWKGGKLRLEKAKEHYLLRLRREWQEDAEHASEASSHDADSFESHDSLEKQKKPSSSDKMQLRIFFPKLGKVKSLASVGIGKHKYSFQRVQVPSIPTHFCDCEEHSGPFLTAKEKHSSESENASGGINEQELNIMNSVMNKIFQRQKPSQQAVGDSELMNGSGNSINSNDELLTVEDDEEDYLTDEDNLIINVMSKRSESMDLLREMKTVKMNQEPVSNKLRTSRDGKPNNAHDKEKKKIMPRNQKRKLPHPEENDGNDTVISEAGNNPQIHLNTQKDSRTELESGAGLLASNSLPSKKSKWKDLVGQNGSTAFSISDIISKVPREKREETSGGDLDLPPSRNVQNQEKKVLRRSKKSESDNNGKEIASSIPKMSSQMDHTSSELESTQQVSMTDILPSVSPQKEEEPRTDNLGAPLTANTREFSTTDTLPGVSEQKLKEPGIDDLDVPVTENMENEDVEKQENTESQSSNPKDLEKPNDAPPAEQNEDLIRTARGASWRHQSSWTQLISSTNNSSFSISQFVPDLGQKHEQQVDIHGNTTDNLQLPSANENLNTAPPEPLMVSVPNHDQNSAGVVTGPTFSEKEPKVTEKKNEVPLSSPFKKNTKERKRVLSLGALDFEETCPFMRTEASIKQWRKAKAATRGPHKKKRSVGETT